MSVFKKSKGTSLTLRKSKEQNVIVSVPDIKEYLVKEYERVNDLKLINERLEQQLQEATELKLRLERAEREIKGWKESYQRARQKINSCKGNLSKKTACEIVSSYEKE